MTTRTFDVWQGESDYLVIGIDMPYDPPLWHFACHAVINYAKSVAVDRTRPVMARENGSSEVHLVDLLGPPGDGAYAKYLGTSLPQDHTGSKPL